MKNSKKNQRSSKTLTEVQKEKINLLFDTLDFTQKLLQGNTPLSKKNISQLRNQMKTLGVASDEIENLLVKEQQKESLSVLPSPIETVNKTPGILP